MKKGITLYDAENIVNKDLLLTACKKNPIGTIQEVKSTIADLKPKYLLNLLHDIKKLDKEKFTDRIK